jgi:hypothetical protein
MRGWEKRLKAARDAVRRRPDVTRSFTPILFCKARRKSGLFQLGAVTAPFSDIRGVDQAVLASHELVPSRWLRCVYRRAHDANFTARG